MHGNDLIGLLLSLALIIFCFSVSFLIRKKNFFGLQSNFYARKIVHIGVSNFSFIYLKFFSSFLFPFLGLISFALLNFIIELRQRKKIKDKTSWGTVEYPLIIALLVLLSNYGMGTESAVAVSLLGMGYGDGFAAILGMTIKGPKMPFCRNKTVVGSLSMFFFVFLFCSLIGNKEFGICLICAFLSMLTEAYTPFELDNLTVPVIIFLIMGVGFSG